MSSSFSSSSSHWPSRTLKSIVREALLTSVTCTAPPVSCQTSQLSTVPKASSPRLGLLARAGHVVEQPLELGAGEVGVDDAGRCARGSCGSSPRSRSSAQMRLGAAVLPDDGVVDRRAGAAVPDQRGLALVGDAERRDVLRTRAGLRRAPRARWRAGCPRSRSGSCSTQPGCGKIWRNSRCAIATICPARSNTMLRELEVPWSRASRKFMVSPVFSHVALHVGFRQQAWKRRRRHLVGEQAIELVDVPQLHHRRRG